MSDDTGWIIVLYLPYWHSRLTNNYRWFTLLHLYDHYEDALVVLKESLRAHQDNAVFGRVVRIYQSKVISPFFHVEGGKVTRHQVDEDVYLQKLVQ